MKHTSSFRQIAQWLVHVRLKHGVVGSNPTPAYCLYGIEKPRPKMNILYIGTLGYTLFMINLVKLIQKISVASDEGMWQPQISSGQGEK